MRQGGQFYFYQNDALGTPKMITSATGAVAWSATYDAFGQAQVLVSFINNNLRLPGQYYDGETGLHYNFHRDYDPVVWRYISEDPIGFAGGTVNLYEYVAGNPVNWIDPSGLRVNVLGSPEENAVLYSWLDTLGDCCDSEVKNRLRTLRDSTNIYSIKFTDNMIRAGQYKNGLVELDPVLKDPNQTTFFYSPPFFTKRPGTPYFGGPDTLAHELLGHGFDAENGFYGQNESNAIRIANKVRDCLGKTRRGGWFDK